MLTFPSTIGYCTSKTALIGLTKVCQTNTITFTKSGPALCVSLSNTSVSNFATLLTLIDIY